MPTLIMILTIVMMTGFVSTRLAAMIRVPHSVLLVLLGIVAGVLARAEGSALIPRIVALFPGLTLYVLLPPLVFESSFHLDVQFLRRDLAPVTALATTGLLVSTLVLGYGLHWVFDFELLPALTFGALISATDPIAVVALFKEVGASGRLTTLIESESLFNDGTAIVLFRVLLGLAATQASGGEVFARGAWTFVQVSLGGIAVGFAVAQTARLLLRLTSQSSSSQLGLTIATAYLSYLIAEDVAHVSGVMATMTAGLVIGQTARLELNKDAATAMQQTWDLLALSANILVFFLVGISVDLARLAASVALIPGTVLLAYLARAGSIYGLVPLFNFLGIAERISLKYQTVLVWGGLRGGLALALVLLLPLDFPHRDLFFLLALAVVLSTLLVNAVTTKSVLRLLGLDRLEEQEQTFYEHVAADMQAEVFGPLLGIAQAGVLSLSLVESHRDAAFVPNLVSTDQKISQSFGLSHSLLSEQRIYEKKRREGFLTRASYLALSQTVNERLNLLRRNDLPHLETYPFDLIRTPQRRPWAQPVARAWSSQWMLRRLTEELAVMVALYVTLGEAVTLAHGRADVDTIAVVSAWRRRIKTRLDEFYRAYPHYSGVAQSRLIGATVRAQAKAYVEELAQVGVITPAVVTVAFRTIETTYAAMLRQAGDLLRPSPAYLLGRLPTFKQLPRVALRRLADSARRVIIEPGTVLVRDEEPMTSMFVIVAGVLEVLRPGRSAGLGGGEALSLATGDLIGGDHLSASGPHRRGTVVALTTCELLEINAAQIRHLLVEYPSSWSDGL